MMASTKKRKGENAGWEDDERGIEVWNASREQKEILKSVAVLGHLGKHPRETIPPGSGKHAFAILFVNSSADPANQKAYYWRLLWTSTICFDAVDVEIGRAHV